MNMKRLVLIVMMSVFSILGFAQEDIGFGVDMDGNIPKGLNVGDKAPMFVINSIDGQKVDAASILKEKELVIIFYRGEWCPVCTRYLSSFNDSLEYINAKGTEVLAIGPETSQNGDKTKENTGADFTIIADSTQQIARDYDVLFDVTKGYQRKIKTFLRTDIAENNGSDKAQLPVPATFVIGKDGIIKFKQFDYNYKNRASVKEILEHLD